MRNSILTSVCKPNPVLDCTHEHHQPSIQVPTTAPEAHSNRSDYLAKELTLG
jgi:hypothetical protein